MPGSMIGVRHMAMGERQAAQAEQHLSRTKLGNYTETPSDCLLIPSETCYSASCFFYEILHHDGIALSSDLHQAVFFGNVLYVVTSSASLSLEIPTVGECHLLVLCSLPWAADHPNSCCVIFVFGVFLKFI